MASNVVKSIQVRVLFEDGRYFMQTFDPVGLTMDTKPGDEQAVECALSFADATGARQRILTPTKIEQVETDTEPSLPEVAMRQRRQL